MKTKPRFASLLAVLFASAPLLSAGEVERLRSLVAEQEMQIQQLELKIAQLSNSSTPVSAPPTPISTPAAPETLQTPASDKGLVPTAETCPEPATTNNPATYTVQAGDNMVKIARKHGTTSAILNDLNDLKKDAIIRPGQKLKLPASATLASTEDASIPVATPAPVATPVEIETPVSSTVIHTVKHTVTSGETFFSIAKKHSVSIDALVKENPSINPKNLRIGQVVQIPGNSDTANLSPVPTPEQILSLSGQSQRNIPISSQSQHNIPISSQSASTHSQSRAADKPVKITEEISYSDFAKQYNTTTSRLDQLNGLRLDPTTVLAKGSELYIPEQR